jgi:putative heme-binding domain-containing protein
MNGVMHVVAQLDDATEASNLQVIAVAPGPATDEGPRKFVKMWELADLAPAMAGEWAASRSLERGRAVFSQAGCIQCHYFRGEGVRTAPDLSEVRKKYHDAELLKQVLEPSASILEGYEGWVFLRNDGSDVVGRIVKEDADGWQVAAKLQKPDEVELVKKSELQMMKKSKLSLMPTGLLVTFSRDEILDLIAFLQSEPPKPARNADGGSH